MRKIFLLMIIFSSIMLPQTWQHYNTSNSQIPGNKINSITFGADGTAWIATNNGLASFKNNVWTTFGTSDGLSSNLVNTLLMIAQGNENLWLGTDNGTTDFTVSENSISSDLTYFNTNNSDILSDKISALGIDINSNIWLGTDRGISVLLQSGVRNISVGDPTVGEGLKSNVISGFAVNADGQINVSTAGGGVSRFNYDEVDGISSASIIEETWSALQSDSVFAVNIGSDNISWFGTEKGIFTFLGGDSKDFNNWIAYYHAENGLINNRVTSITEDSFGNKWVGTKGGVSYYDGNSWRSFTTENGLISNDVSTIAVDSENNIWIGSDNGLSKLSDFSVDIENHSSIPEEYELNISVYPNPFNPSTNVNYTTGESGNIKLNIYDLTGQKVKSLVNEFTKSGTYQKRWNGLNDNGKQMPSGIYFVMLESAYSTTTQKIVLLR